MTDICDFVIFGGEGDLAFRKLYPALYSLDADNLLPDCVRVIGAGRGKFDKPGFLAEIRRWAGKSEYAPAVDERVWTRFADRIEHFTGDATDADSLASLRDTLLSDTSRDLVIYLSTPPSIFAPICQAVHAAGLIRRNTRIVVEKPLGESLASFDQINTDFLQLFGERQVYRIDHYLGKETVQNLLALRFANSLFEPLWNSRYIDHVQITVAESVGVAGRWAYYDGSGALRDMVQNHLLQLLCLAAMEPPAGMHPDAVRDEKLKVLDSLKPIEADAVKDVSVRGQYQAGAVERELVPGYLEEEDAAGDRSSTETFVALKTEIENWRWNGVPFYLRTGKRLSARYSEISFQFKQVPHNMFPSAGGDMSPNRLSLFLQPEEGVRLHIMNKLPGLSPETTLQPVSLNLSFGEAFKQHRATSAYEKLLLDIMRGDQTLFMRSDELRAAWRWVDGIIEGWRNTGQPALSYRAGSWGPDKSVALLARDDRQWHEYLSG